MPIHNKLVRDQIPELIEKAGKTPVTRTLALGEYKQELRAKLLEEVQEYIEAETNTEAVEELADVLEVMRALASVHEASIVDVERVRKEKANKRGGFREGIFLEKVVDD
ncbi:nucleoside triphosphate pyrophosphohydrolase [Shouchella shacheensis]|uniref:nucleoside triphosphate pyrophosphohydrolase n=1 Tax=Shouchella shacheensis TaxID=1649580 RepID=UPI0007403E65|nr:nucleoside triphosphate pyrophosphohydrolase [Shouchella shacheensis]